jgi:hypothetical protein
MIPRLFELLRPLLAIAVLGAIVLTPILAFIARFGDGPLGPFPGGPLQGSLRDEPDSGWAFALRLETVAVEVDSDPPRSVTTGVLVHQGDLYLPVTFASFQRWDDVVREHPRVLVRVGDRVYERHARPVDDPDWQEELFADARERYGTLLYPEWAFDDTDFFRLDPP